MTFTPLSPTFKRNNVALFLATDAGYLPYVSVLLASILSTSSRENNYDLILLHENLKPDQGLNLLLKQVEEYPNVSLRFLDTTPLFISVDLPIHSHITRTTYYRLKAPSLFAHDKILYLDIDTLVREDIATLYATELGDAPLAAVTDLAQAMWVKSGKKLFYGYFTGRAGDYLTQYLGLKHPELYLQAGCLLFNLKVMRASEAEDTFMRIIASRKRLHWMDQDILNIVYNRTPLVCLSRRWNFIQLDLAPSLLPEIAKEYSEAQANPAIIHYASGAKPWHYTQGDLNLLWWTVAERTPFVDQIEARLAVYTKRRIRLRDRLKSWLKDDTLLGRWVRRLTARRK